MPVLRTDPEINALIVESKPLPSNYRTRIAPRPKKGHSERELRIAGSSGSLFLLVVRQSLQNVLDFSVILALLPGSSNQVFRLRRYNGKSHEHTNLLERQAPFYDFHIHLATERYQRAGLREDWFAEPTARYSDLQSALDCLIADCGLVLPAGERPQFFGLEQNP